MTFFCKFCKATFSSYNNADRHANLKHKEIISEETTTSTSQISTQFVDCGPTIKEEIKEENVEFHDPLSLSNDVQSLNEPVTYEEFFFSTENMENDSEAFPKEPSSIDEIVSKEDLLEEKIIPVKEQHKKS